MINRFLKKKHIRLSFQEFFALERGEITLEDIYFNRKLERFATKVMTSKYKLAVVFMIASGFLVINTARALAVDTSKIDNLGSTILGLIRTCGYWFCLILATKEIITSLMEGNTKKIGNIVVHYLAAFGAFYALPWLFDLIKDLLA